MKQRFGRVWKIRRLRGGALLVLSAYCLAAAAVIAHADETNLAGDKAELQLLKERLAKLEDKVSAQEATAAGAEPGKGIIQLPSGLQGVQMSGFVDTTFTYNLNHPQNGNNALRVFDNKTNTFMINNAELNLEKPVSADSPFGFKTSLMFGTDAEVVGSVTTGLGIDGNTVSGLGNDEFELKDAYAEYLAPLGNGLDLKAGKFATLHGAEVIESKDNWNISRSILFGFAIPFTHTGVRATYPVTEWLSATLGFDNGWDVVDDNNQAKTIETAFTLTPMKNVSLTTNYMIGSEQAGNNGKQRSLLDIVASYQPIDPLQLKLNFDYGWEDDAAGFKNNASWNGLAGYVRYQVNDWFALAGRSEYFVDADGVRTALTSGINGIRGTDLHVQEYTLTGEFKINKHLISRLEYRHDQSSEKIFRNRDTGQRSYQDTVGFEVIAPF